MNLQLNVISMQTGRVTFILSILFLLFFNSQSIAQELEEAQFDSTILEDVPLIKIARDGDRYRGVNMIANMRFALNSDFDKASSTTSFKANDVRLEIIGNVTEELKIRFRDVLSRSAGDGATLDQLRRSIDLAYAEYALNDRLIFTGGKMFAEYGGFEIFYNPITMVVYNEMIPASDVFVSAFKTNYLHSNQNRFSLQIANSSSRKFSDDYGTTVGAQAPSLPMSITANWNGSFANKKIQTKWSLTRTQVAKSKDAYLMVLGEQFRFGKLALLYDYKLSLEDLDRSNILSSNMGFNFQTRLSNVAYQEHWVRVEYNFTDNFRFTGMGMSSAGYWLGNPDENANDREALRVAYTYTGSLEYRFVEEHNLRAFLSYVGKTSTASNYAKSQFGMQNQQTNQILFGIMGQFIVF